MRQSQKETLKRNGTLIAIIVNVLLTLGVVWTAAEYKGGLDSDVDNIKKKNIEIQQKLNKQERTLLEFEKNKKKYLSLEELNHAFVPRNEDVIEKKAIKDILERIDKKIDRIERSLDKK